MAIAIVRACIRDGARSRFFNVAGLVNKLEAEARSGRQSRLAEYLCRKDFVVLDELGYLPFAQSGGQLLFHLISRLYEQIKAAGIAADTKTMLFRSAHGRTGNLTLQGMNRIDAYRMVQRRAAALGMKVRICCHTFRATGITAYLEAGGSLEKAQAMAAHESPRTTKLYDRTGDEITLDEVERIKI